MYVGEVNNNLIKMCDVNPTTGALSNCATELNDVGYVEALAGFATTT